MFITGPDVIKSITGETINFDNLGGALPHNEKSGVAQFIMENEKECFETIKLLLDGDNTILSKKNEDKSVTGARIITDDSMHISGMGRNILPEKSWLTWQSIENVNRILNGSK